VQLPSGGWVGLALAIAVAAAVTVMRLRRRYRRHRYGDLAPTATDPPLPRAVRVLERAAASAHTDPVPVDDPRADQPPTSSPARRRAWPPPVPVVTGFDQERERTLDLTTVAGIGLHGPGAAPAARAVITGLLAENATHPARVQLTAEATTLLSLPKVTSQTTTSVADSAAPCTSTGVEHGNHLPEALNELEAELIRRMRLVEDHQLRHTAANTHSPDQPDQDPSTAHANAFAACRHADPAEPLPTMLLCATVPASLTPRVAAVLELGRCYDIIGLLLHPWHAGNSPALGWRA
jgi:hypothetical protein